MSDKEQQIRNTIIYMLPTGLGTLLPFITLPIFTRILTPEDYGILGLAMIYAIFAGGLVNFGMTKVFDRNFFKYKKNKHKLAQLVYSSLVFIVLNLIFILIITYIFKGEISLFLTGSAEHGIFILVTFLAQFFLGSGNGFFYAFLRNYERASNFAKYKVYESLLIFTLGLILIAYFRIGIIGIVIARLISGSSLFFFFFYLLLRELPFSFNKSILLESLKICYPLSPILIVRVLNTQLDKYMVGLLYTIGGVGVYHIGKSIAEIVHNFMNVLQNVFHPQVYLRMFGQHEQGSESIGRYLTPFLYISIFMALCVSLFSKELVTILTPVSYHGAIPIIIILAMYYGLFFFAKVPAMMYAKKTLIISLFSIIGVVVNIAINIPLIKEFGVVGAAWGTLIVGLIMGISGFSVAQHYYKIYYEWGKVAWIMGTFLLSATILASLNLMNAPYLLCLLIKITALTVFINRGIRYGIISKENFRLLGSFLRVGKAVKA